MAADLTTKADLPSAWLIRFSPYLKAGTRVRNRLRAFNTSSRIWKKGIGYLGLSRLTP